EAVVVEAAVGKGVGLRVHLQVEALEAVHARKRASAIEASQGLLQIDQLVETVVATGRLKGVEVVGLCQPCPPPDRPLVLCKWADRQAAQVGEVVTFFLKYTNQGGQPITGIIVSDSLSQRLEFVPGSAVADRDAGFTTQENEVGSLILRWEVSGPLPPGQSGLVRFQAR